MRLLNAPLLSLSQSVLNMLCAVAAAEYLGQHLIAHAFVCAVIVMLQVLVQALILDLALALLTIIDVTLFCPLVDGQS